MPASNNTLPARKLAGKIKKPAQSGLTPYRGITNPSSRTQDKYWHLYEDYYTSHLTMTALGKKWDLHRNMVSDILNWCALQRRDEISAIKARTVADINEGIEDLRGSLKKVKVKPNDLPERDKAKYYIDLRGEIRRHIALKGEATGVLKGNSDGSKQQVVINMPEIAKLRHSGKLVQKDEAEVIDVEKT